MKIIKLKGNPNIRDLGGSYHSLTLREGMLIRGRTFLNLSEDQKADLVNKYHLKTIIDLRSTDEQNEEPELLIEGVKYLSMPIFEREKAGISHTNNEKIDRFEIYRHLPHMDEIYFNMLHDESLENIAKIIKRIITANEDEYGIYFHCSEGKDRTGIIAAILLLLLGVDKKDIMKDYLLTNKMAKRKAFKYYMHIKYLRFDAIFALKVGRAFLAKRKYLNTLYRVIKDEYGDEDNFFKTALHLTDEEIDIFRKRMII